jgi:hypothetical protein
MGGGNLKIYLCGISTLYFSGAGFKKIIYVTFLRFISVELEERQI